MKGEGNARSWPPIHIETLKRLWGESRTATQIAEEIPYSRSAILGMARRLDLPARPRVVAPPRPPAAPRRLPIATRIENMVRLVADHKPLRAAAEAADVPWPQARAWFNWMLNHYDMGEPATMTDDVERPVHA